MRGISPDAKPTVTNRPPRAHGAQRLLRVRAADRVDDDVGTAVGELLDARLEILGAVVDDRVRAAIRTDLEPVLARGGGQHLRTHEVRELHRRQADAAGAPSTTTHSPGASSATLRNEWYAVPCATPSADAATKSAPAGMRVRADAGTVIFSANAPTNAAPNTRSPGARADDVGRDLLDHTRELAPGDERHRHRDLVPVLEQEEVREVDRGGAHRDAHLARPDLRVGQLLDGDAVDAVVAGAARGAHHGRRPTPVRR